MRTKVAVFLATLLSALVVLLGLGAGPAAAEGESIFGFLKNAKGKADPVPVPGVEVTVKGPGGVNETATSDEDGRWTVETNQAGTFTVTLDQETLPKGVTLRNPDADTIKVPVAEGQDKPVLFALGKSTRNVQSKWSQAAQLTAEGLRFGLILALAAVGLSLIFGTTGLTNFAHGELVTIGAMITWWLSVGNMPFLPDFGGLQFFPAAAVALLLMRGGRLGQRRLALATPAPARHRPDRRDDRLDRAVALPALLLPLHVQRQHPVSTPTTEARRAIEPRPDRPGGPRLLVSMAHRDRRAGRRDLRAAAHPDRQGDPGGVRQPGARRRVRHRRRPGHPGGLGRRRRAGRPRPASCWACRRASTSRWASRSCC